ncbi:Pex19 protein family-domain-containing protein [Xylogone sp. PMI_703]|nr:Pex19 protein family-domain-containing protein [Xylogone sp. PMI_703]
MEGKHSAEPIDSSQSKSEPAESKLNIASAAKEPIPEAVPDPDEDDLDDLDDMLDEFSETKLNDESNVSSGPERTKATDEDTFAAGISDEEFSKQLQAGMAELMGELDKNPDMQAQLENIFKELGGAEGQDTSTSSPKAATSSGKSGPSGTAAEDSFQDTIRKTMERMQASGDQATAAAAAEPTDDILAEMLKAMQASGFDGEGSEEDFSKMLLGMMEQLTNKEILYEPMKELHDKFPGWIEKNINNTPPDDMKRYKLQQTLVAEIVGRFEQKTYNDSNAADREYIVERMQKMQEAGSPPADLVGDMAAAQEAFGAPEEGCPTQ